MLSKNLWFQEIMVEHRTTLDGATLTDEAISLKAVQLADVTKLMAVTFYEQNPALAPKLKIAREQASKPGNAFWLEVPYRDVERDLQASYGKGEWCMLSDKPERPTQAIKPRSFFLTLISRAR